MIIPVPVKLKDEHEIKQHVRLLLFRWDSGPWGIVLLLFPPYRAEGCCHPMSLNFSTRSFTSRAVKFTDVRLLLGDLTEFA